MRDIVSQRMLMHLEQTRDYVHESRLDCLADAGSAVSHKGRLAVSSQSAGVLIIRRTGLGLETKCIGGHSPAALALERCKGSSGSMEHSGGGSVGHFKALQIAS